MAKYKLCLYTDFFNGAENAGLFFGVVEAPAYWFFVKLVAASECDDEEKRLTDELMAKIRAHEYNRSMDLPS